MNRFGWRFGVPLYEGWYLCDIVGASHEAPFVVRYWDGDEWRDRIGGVTSHRPRERWYHELPQQPPNFCEGRER
jgi:hypothetical protein